MNKRTILLVEDDQYNRDILREILEEIDDCQVIEATNGVEALEWLVSHAHPAVILLDMMMPQMDGYALLSQLQQSGQLNGLRVIGISARAQVDDQDKALAAGCWRYLTKPFNISEVETVVNEALNSVR
ncbi:MAG: response regulator [Herpetosiphonaceae bacterium]|nr:response regulator [Herpetosiphonaceae bacterium]